MNGEDVYMDISERLEAQVEANQKLLNFIMERGLLGEFRKWEGKTRGIPSW